MPSPLAIPSYAAATVSPEMAAPDPVNFDAIVAGFDDNYVISGGTVTQRGAGANLSVDVAAAVVSAQSVPISTSLTNLVITPDVTNPRWALVYVTSGGTVTITHGTAAATSPLIPAIPANAIPLAAIFIPANAATIVNADINGMSMVKAAPDGVFSGAAGSAALTNYGRTAIEATVGTDIAAGQFTDSVAGDTIVRSAAGTMRFGIGAAGAAASKLRITSTAVTIPSGTDLVIGTKATKSGTLALAATGNTATVLGQFSSTAGSMSLRMHLHMVTGTLQRTKTYEFVVDTTTDTTNTYYKVLPADQSSATASVNDVFLVCFRPSTATTTWEFWVCTSATFAAVGAVTWSVESYGDSVVTYSSTLTVTTPPTLPFTGNLHPSNSLDTIAGFVNIGTDLGAAPLIVRGSASPIVVTSSSDTNSTVSRVVGSDGSTSVDVGVAGTAPIASGTFSTETLSAGDAFIVASGSMLKLGVSSGPSVVRITATDVQILASGTSRSVPRGLMGRWRATAAGTSATTTATACYSGVTATTGAFTFIAGRRYRAIARLRMVHAATSTTAQSSFALRLGAGATGAIIGIIDQPQSVSASTTYTLVSDPILCGTDTDSSSTVQLPAGSQSFSLVFTTATGTSTVGFTTGSTQANAFLEWEDVGG